ncbi:MAG: T9SS type A sorting domain-containing protein [FCB group bacterium]|nr:T9SS type A sorting domain-containing protein [FCB group bacterium]
MHGLVELFKDALDAAYTEDQIDFSIPDVIVIFHAGIGQDFSLPFLDPTPEDIPSTFVDPAMLLAATGSGSLVIGDATVTQGVILPETQNHLLYSESNPLLDASEPCDFQYALTGTFALMTGFALGLPPLWYTETGASGVGVFSLMDQGSNNGRGLIPSPPDIWSRMFAEWETPQVVHAPENVQLPARSEGNAVKIALTSDEYFLIEARDNAWRPGVNLDSTRYRMWEQTGTSPPLVEIILDSVPHTTDSLTGVITGFDNYDLGLPGTGLLIWHVDEARIQNGMDHYTINGDKQNRGVDLEEADGAQDIGYPNIFLTADPSAGYFGDLWFKGNREHERVNPGAAGGYPRFGPLTYPDTRTNSGAESYVIIDSIGPPADTMSFLFRNGRKIPELSDLDEPIRLIYDFDQDGNAEIIGGENRLWTMDNLNQLNVFHSPIMGELTLVQTGSYPQNQLAVVEATEDSIRITSYRWLSDNQQFSREWEQSVSVNGTDYYIKGDQNSNRIRLFYPTDIITVDKDSIYEALNYWWPDPGHSVVFDIQDSSSILSLDPIPIFTINTTGGIDRSLPPQATGFSSVRFSQILAADINDDQLPDIIALSKEGKLYVFDINFTLLSGFPISVGNAEVVLAGDILETAGREIVTQDSSGVITVWGGNGRRQLTIGVDPADRLEQIANYQGHSVLVCRYSSWVISDFPEDESGWLLPDNNVFHSRTVYGEYPAKSSGENQLLLRSQTYAYPNPAKEGRVTLRYTTSEADKVEITVYSLSGYFVKRWTMENPEPILPQELVWDVGDVEPGVYFVRVTAYAGIKTEEKILKIGIIN